MLIRNQDDPEPRDDEIDDEPVTPPDDNDGDGGAEAQLEDDDPEADEEPADDEQPQDDPIDDDDAEPPPQPRKGKSKDENMAALRAKARRVDELEQELLRTRASTAQPQQPQQETPQARHARLAAMPPDERAVAIAAEGEERIHRLSALAEFRIAEREDRADFAEICRSDPRAKKYAAEVEDVLLAERRANRNWSRKNVLAFILGNRVMANAPKAKKQQDAARKEAVRQQGSPAKPKGDVGGGKKQLSEAQAREKRLLNVRI